MNPDAGKEESPEKRKRLLLVARGMEGNGQAEYDMAYRLMKAGFEVVYVGGLLSQKAIEISALQEGVDFVCMAADSSGPMFPNVNPPPC